MPVYVNDFTAIISGSSWSLSDGTPTVVTYSFETSAQSYLSQYFSQAFINSFQAFTAQQEDLARGAFAQWAAVSGITFVEVAPGEGDIRLGNFDFAYSSTPNSTGFAYSPGRDVFASNTQPPPSR